MSTKPSTPWALAAAAIFAALVVAGVAARATNPNALWNIVHGQCVPNQMRHGDPAPCAAVDLKNGVARGHAVLKDLHGATHFLLIPTARITGIESPALLAPGAPNYFAAAWRARSFVEKALGHRLPDDALGLAVNSMPARSQNQLHIHIDCIRADVRRALHAARRSIGTRWRPLAAPLDGHRYQAMRIVADALRGHNPFKLLAERLPGAGADMGQRTLAVLGMVFDRGQRGFVVLEDRADPARGDRAWGSHLLDRACALGH